MSKKETEIKTEFTWAGVDVNGAMGNEEAVAVVNDAISLAAAAAFGRLQTAEHEHQKKN